MCDVSELDKAKINDTFASEKEPFKWILIGIDFSGKPPKVIKLASTVRTHGHSYKAAPCAGVCPRERRYFY